MWLLLAETKIESAQHLCPNTTWFLPGLCILISELNNQVRMSRFGFSGFRSRRIDSKLPENDIRQHKDANTKYLKAAAHAIEHLTLQCNQETEKHMNIEINYSYGHSCNIDIGEFLLSSQTPLMRGEFWLS